MADVYKWIAKKKINYDKIIIKKGDIVDAFFNIKENGLLIFLSNGWWFDSVDNYQRF